MEKSIVFFDTEIGTDDNQIHDIGAIRTDRAVYHRASLKDFSDFIQDSQYLAGHNIVHHDLVYIQKAMGRVPKAKIIDTLYLSPLLFPKSPYHRLVKDDKIQSDTLNNPVNDSKNSQKVFYDEVNAFSNLPMELKQIFCGLLYNQKEFTGFFDYMDMTPDSSNLANTIHKVFMKKICANADLYPFINHSPIELAYALALIDIDDAHSITPRWLVANFPQIDYIIHLLRNLTCQQGCSYCKENLNVGKALKDIFGYDQFRTYNGEPLQEKAAQAAVDNKSLLAVFPTGGGKSITFQLPALMAGKATHGLTVVISPLQSLMKDQVDNLNSMGITEAVTVNGLLDPIERSDSLERVKNGGAKLLYISPEQLRSKTIQSILRHRNIARFVIDEAHCFSAWGQDFRVDYLYIGDFIGELQKQKNGQEIPVSCFTATAKQKVITDICDYFKRKLGIELQIYASDATRENLHYKVLFKETDEEKYNELRNLLSQKNCSTIIYASRTKTTIQLAEKLTSDGFAALAFNGKMDTKEKIANQDAFMRNEVNIIVATSAFGMGVDKKDVKLVVHYDISDSLENYVQEAGRAGRDPSLQAECYVLFNDRDLDKHFVLLNQTKLSISEIQQVWKAVKDLTRQRSTICCSPLEIARQAGWDDSVNEIETRVKTAISALETAGYVKRGRNMPHVYANSILAKDMMDAAYRIDGSSLFSPPQRDHAKRIIKSLISSRSLSKMGNEDAESRVDYLADILGMTKEEVISAVNLMRQEGLLADSLDMSAYIMASDSENKSKLALDRFAKLERYLIAQYTEQGLKLNFKEINQAAQESGIGNSTVRNLKTLYYYHHIKGYVQRTQLGSSGRALPAMDQEKLLAKQQRRINICLFALDNLYQKAKEMSLLDQGETPVQFSLIGLLQDYKNTPQLEIDVESTTQADLEDALLYLSKIGALKIEGGFLVIYNAMEIKRLILENRIRYKAEDYRFLDEFYKQKIRQIHIVGEYANLMVSNYQAALQFVKDYFQMDFKQFMAKYFVGKKAADIHRNITPQKYHELFDDLSDIQSQIINDAQSKYIVVAAGPGSGKTRVLVHKLASLLILEDVKHEQLLMVTFSRAAATEFKKRLIELIGPSANFVDIKTFHSYCFDLLGKIGSLEGVQNIVADAAEMIANGEVEPGKITKSVLVIDEAQDMDGEDFNLIKALMQANEDMRVIAVGDDDQNIYAFRGSDAKYFRAMIEDYGANKYEMVESYRSKSNIIDLSNAFVKSIPNRMKTDDIKGLQKENGRVLITRHRSKNMAQAVVDQVVETRENNKSCILTNTNDEALQVLGLLHQSGIRGKLIQSLDGFKLSNLVEIRYFLKVIDKKLKSPVISEELWAEGKSKLFETYKQSSSLEICNNLIRDFEQITREKYRSDLEEFINESNYEDFYNEDKESVLVSTIHKSKGREFDNVYLLLKDVNSPDPEELRKLYVGITRAKRNLYIHSNTPLFDQYQIEGITHVQDHNIYQEPKEILLQLTHRDVVLDFFKDKKEKMLQLRSGDKLKIDHKYLLGELNQQMVPLAKLSKGFCEKLERLQTKGYQPYQGEVRFVVAWKGEEDTAESAVLLPNIYLKKV